jgi:hypothetical protein
MSPAIPLGVLGVFPNVMAMNHFRVANGSEPAFEHVWMPRESHLDNVPRSPLR